MKKREQLPIQPCSTQELEEALELLEGRLKILILFHRFSAPVLRFSELQTVAHRLIRPRKRLFKRTDHQVRCAFRNLA